MKVEREGLGYRAAIVADGISISVDRLVESRGTLRGEVTVERAPEGHLMKANLGLSEVTARRGAADYLRRRASGVDWTALLETFCVEVLRQERAGNPVVTIGARKPRAAVTFRLEPMLPIGKPCILFGEEGTGKSTLAAAIAYSVATGGPAYARWYIPEPTPVLILDWEGDEADWTDLVNLVAAGMGSPAPDAINSRTMAGPLTADIHGVARLVEELGIGLLIVDSVGLASPSGREGADASEGALRLFQGLRAIGTTSLLIDHVNKSAGTDSGSSRPYGSVYKPALARATYELVAAEEADDDGARHMVLFHRKANTTARQAPIGIKVTRDDDAIRLAWEKVSLRDGRVAAKVPQSMLVMDALSGGAMTYDELSVETGIAAPQLRVVVNRMKKAGQVVQTGTRDGQVTWGNTLRNTLPPGGVTAPTPFRGVDGGGVTPTTRASSFDGLRQWNEGRTA